MKSLKMLGSVLVGVFAMSAVVASAASAVVEFKAESSPTVLTGESPSRVHQGLWISGLSSPAEFKTESNPTELTGSQEGSDVFTLQGGTATCTKVTYEGAMTGTETEEFEVEPTYSGCTAFGFVNVPIHANGCKFKFTANQTMHIVCPTGKAFEVTAPGCTNTIGSQTPTGPNTIEYTNIGSGSTMEVTIDMSLTGLH
jgi:hypothetical protein